MAIAINMNQIKPSDVELKSATAQAGFAVTCDLLRKGEIAAIPTETVYGLAADSANSDAVAKIYTAKGRPSFNPLIVHVEGIEQAQKLVYWNDTAQSLADQFWPGPLTMVMEAKADNGIAAIVSAGLPTLAIRCPAHPIMRAVLIETGLNLAAPSANKSGQLSATSAEHVRRSFGLDTPFILDGGICENGLESTIVAIRNDGWQILRPGPITKKMLTDYIDIMCLDTVKPNSQTHNKPNSQTHNKPNSQTHNKIEAPGQLDSHYAPQKPLRLNASAPMEGEYFIGFGDIYCDYNLSLSGDLVQAAQQLFIALHLADNSDSISIAVAVIDDEGIGVAINDRLKRAAV